VGTEIEGSFAAAAAHWLGPLLRSKRRRVAWRKKRARSPFIFTIGNGLNRSVGLQGGRGEGNKERSRERGWSVERHQRQRRTQMRMPSDGKRSREMDERERDKFSAATACVIHAFYYYTTRPLSRQLYESFFVSLWERSLSAILADETNRLSRAVRTYVRLLWLLTRGSSSDVSRVKRGPFTSRTNTPP